uniref:RNA-directed DNA polymerase, eukaryota, reverse transcriptase zinc-binding domain protein n=1 Tax=Tanacetum cinerariifolium TaxID=118510 RepID=A0A6L2JIN7_TANCI|nr:RNA-directed DNA polymerase, eukaryota, reverse transcriptase zinc-binding domain protein [Tanacetum cinerariifolium]
MVSYLTKSDASKGFTQIIDFLNGSYLKFALTVNPNMYVSCIKQFWNTIAIKQINDVTRLQALVDKKKVVVTEAAIREVLRLDDAEGVDCLPNEEIFTELARMGYEKPSTKLTFYKAFFSSQWKFLIYTIMQCMSDLLTHTTKYASPTLTQKVFANMRRVGKGFSGVETPLFEGMLVDQEIEEEGDEDEHVEDVTAGDDALVDDTAAHGEVPTVTQAPSIPSPTLTIPPSQPPQDIPSTSQVQQTPLQSPQVQPPSPQPQPQQQAADFPMSLLQEALDACAALTRRVEHLEYDKIAQALEITKLKRRMIDKMDKDDAVVLMDEKEEDTKVEEAKVDEILAATLTAAPTRVTAAPSRRRKGVIIRDPKKELTTSEIIPAEAKSKDKGKGILVEEPKPLKKKQHIEMDEEYARKLHAELNKDIDWDVAIDYVKLKAKEDPVVKRYQAIKRKPPTEAQARKNMMVYLKNVDGFKLDYFKGISYDDIQKAAKRRKMNEEVEDLKRHLEIVPDEDDDVYTEATPLARKVHVVDYEIIELNNKPYYKIIRADGTHQLYISFLTLLKNCDIEDLEALWNLVKERCTCLSLEESKDYTWSSKGQELEATGIMWCAYHNLYNHAADFVSRKKVPTLKVYSRPDAECCFLTAKGRGCGKGVNDNHNSVLDDSCTTSKRVKDGIGSPSTVVSHEEPNSRDSLGGKHNTESAANPNLGYTSQKSVTFRTLVTPAGNGADVVVSNESVSLVNERISNTVYRFFLDKRVAYPVVKNYVKNTWSKFGLVKSIMTKDSDSDVKVAYDETAQFMASGGVNDASLYEDEDYDNYDTYDIEGLTKQELAFGDMMDINLYGRGRR